VIGIARRAAVLLLLPGCGALVGVPDYTTGSHVDANGRCEPGFGDCNGDVDDGCEVDLTTDGACGRCGARCVNATCQGDTPGASCQCAPGFSACGGDPNACLSQLASDTHNCGGCGIDCAPGTCLDGHCQPGSIVSDVALPFSSLVVVGDDVYYDEGQNVLRAPIDPTLGDPELLHFIGGAFCDGVAADADHLVWLQRADYAGEIWTSALDGSGAHQLATGFLLESLSGSASQDLALADGYAYWVSIDAVSMQCALRRVPLSGGAVETLATDGGANPYVAIGAHDIYWSAGGPRLFVHPRAAPATFTALGLGMYVYAVGAFGDRACAFADTTSGDALLCGAGADPTSYASVAALTSNLGSIAFDDRAVFATDTTKYQARAFGKNLRDPLAVTDGQAGNLVIYGDGLLWRTPNGIFRLRHAFDP
jgi:hypothetical protein